MRHLLSLEIGELLVWRVGFDDHDQVVALKLLGRAFDRKRHCPREIDGKSRGAGGKAGNMQAARAHRLDFRRIRLDLIEHDLFVQAFPQRCSERLEYIFVDGGVLDRGVGEHDRRRVLPFLRIGRRVCDHIVVVIAIHGVELAAMLAGFRGVDAGCEHQETEAGKCRKQALQHGIPFFRPWNAALGTIFAH